MDFFELFNGLVGVDLGRGQIGVTQQGFDRIEIGPVVQHMGGKAVPENVRASLRDRRNLHKGLFDQIHHQFRIQRGAFVGKKQRGFR